MIAEVAAVAREQEDPFIMVYGVFLRETHLEVALVPRSTGRAASQIHRALRSFDGVGGVTRTRQRGIIFFNVRPASGVELVDLSQRLVEHMDVAAPQDVTCIVGPAIRGAKELECAGVIYDEPDPTMHITIDTVCEFTRAYIGPTEVEFMHLRGFVISVDAGKARHHKPTLADALCFTQLRPNIETVGQARTVSSFVQMFTARLRQQ